MQASSKPSKIQTPWANSGTKNTIPVASQVSVTPGAASYADGFPPLTMTPLASGGVPPSGADFNGILNAVTAIQQWQSSGGAFAYDSAFATAIGGYPKGAVLVNAANDGYWLNLADNNSTNPDATDGSAANWYPVDGSGIAAVTGLTNANVTLTPAQYGKPVITLAGALTANVQIIFPALAGVEWTVFNNTTGNFTVTAKTASGTGVVVPQLGQRFLYSDGANIATLGPTGLQAAGVNLLTASTALTAGQAGSTILCAPSGSITMTLPALSSLPLGARFEFFSTGNVTIAQNAADSNGFTVNGGARPSTLLMRDGDTLTVEKADVTGAGVYVWLAVGGSVTTDLGVGQLWQDVSASRAFNTNYTNSTTKPIEVYASGTNTVGASSSALTFSVSGILVDSMTIVATGGATSQEISVRGVVPPGATYAINQTNATKSRWAELR